MPISQHQFKESLHNSQPVIYIDIKLFLYTKRQLGRMLVPHKTEPPKKNVNFMLGIWYSRPLCPGKNPCVERINSSKKNSFSL